MEGARYLEDGKLTIFRRAGTYYARLRLSPEKYVVRSLKTTSEQTAIQAGRRLLFHLGNAPAPTHRANDQKGALAEF
jgi:hypothetical protein